VRRALILTPEYPPYLHGGLGTHVGELAAGLDRAGWSVEVVLVPLLDGAAPDLGGAVDGTRIRVHVAAAVHKSRMKDVIACAQASIAEAPPDVLHAHDMFFLPAAISLRRAHRIPLVGTAHLLEDAIGPIVGEPPNVGRREMERLLCSSVDRLIAVSASMADLAVDYYGAERARVRVVHNGFRAQAFARPSCTEAELAQLRARVAAADERIVLFAGRVAPQKGANELCEVARLVAMSRPRVRFVVAGEAIHAGHRAGWEEMCARLEPPVLTRMGKVPRSELALLYRLAEVAVVPSIYEPFGYAALEAMASGVPLVASAVGGLVEIVAHEETGLLVPTLSETGRADRVDAPAFAAAIVRLLDEPDTARRLAHNAAAHVTRFSHDRMAAETIAVYLESMAEGARA
jgi:glycosyltransferase involved in cell wall biosynthesis